MRQPLRCARKPVRSSVHIGEVLNANAYPSDYRGAIWPAGSAGAADAQDLWTGRNWNLTPSKMVGDFDAGQDPFDGEQRTAAIETVAHLVRAFGLQDATSSSTIS